MKRTPNDEYSEEEAKRRFEAALRGAREVGHEPMKDIPPKRFKPEMQAKAKAIQLKERGRPKRGADELPPSQEKYVTIVPIIAVTAAMIAAIAAIHAAFFALKAVRICEAWEASLRARSDSST
jgi:hypothetical protein